MKRIACGLCALLVSTSILGCPLGKKKQDAGDDPDLSSLLDAATVSVSGTGAKNEGQVLRYATEQKLDEPGVITVDGVVVRNFPGNGPMIATVNKGTPVQKLAQYFSSGILIQFDEPGTGDKLIGWVPLSAFVAPPGQPIPTATATLKPIVRIDAGSTPTFVDAGSTGPKDAGGVPDAAGSVKPKGGLAVAPINGKCDSGYALLNNMCRMTCTADTQCPRGTFCVNKYGGKHCTADK
jgi:hypothetical protein